MRSGTLFSGLFQPSPAEQADLFAGETQDAARKAEREADDAMLSELFNGGPPAAILTALGLIRPGAVHVVRRMLIVIAIGWLPLLVLNAIESALTGNRALNSFLSDFGVHARSLIAAPLLVAGEFYALPRLSALARHFPESGLIAPKDAPAFAHAALSTYRLRDSTRLEVALIAIAITAVFTMALQVPLHVFPYWQVAGPHGGHTPAAIWHEFISVPILAILVLGWFWRVFLWGRFLVLMSRLDLKLVAAHPDRSGGLAFLGTSLESFAVLAFAFGVIVAGTVANRVVYDGVSLLSFRYVVATFVVVMLLLFVCPLFIFTPRLTETWRRGVLEYGALARSLGVQMERRWLNHSATPDTLDANDFSATTDLYAVAANVYRLLPVPVALRDLAVIVVATLLPFLPVLLMFMSFHDLVLKLTGASL